MCVYVLVFCSFVCCVVVYGGKDKEKRDKGVRKVQILYNFDIFIVFLQADKIKKGIDHGKTN